LLNNRTYFPKIDSNHTDSIMYFYEKNRHLWYTIDNNIHIFEIKYSKEVAYG